MGARVAQLSKSAVNVMLVWKWTLLNETHSALNKGSRSCILNLEVTNGLTVIPKVARQMSYHNLPYYFIHNTLWKKYSVLI
jgi:hypothetical protein